VCVTDHRNRRRYAAPSGNIINFFSVRWPTRHTYVCLCVCVCVCVSTRNVEAVMQGTSDPSSWERLCS
jgi:hypothetical protein